MALVIGSSLLARAGSVGASPPAPIAPGPFRHTGPIIAAGGELLKLISKTGAADVNSAIASYEGEFSQRMSEIEARRVENDKRQKVGTAIANAGASGFTLDSPATVAAINDIVASGNLDAALIRMRGDIAEWRSVTEQIMIEDNLRQSYISGATNMASLFVGGARPESINIGAKR